jgi:hypothetical protein
MALCSDFCANMSYFLNYTLPLLEAVTFISETYYFQQQYPTFYKTCRFRPNT